jgi:thiol-disulfide isomerase/thioredoxin
MKRIIHCVAVAGLLACTGAAEDKNAAALTVGMAAPKLQTGKWVQGGPIKGFDKQHAYIVEFWATWCGPCRATIPHLNALHEKFKDKGLVVIGQNIWEREQEKVPAFLKEMGKDMTYAVALDDTSDGGEGKMSATWMRPAGREGIPSAFVVGKDAKIAWIGHPMELDEPIVEQVLAGKFDVQKAAAAQADRVRQEAEERQIMQQLAQQMLDRKWDTAAATVDTIEKNMPDVRKEMIGFLRMQIALGRNQGAEASKIAKELSGANPDNARLQNAIAWHLATAEGIDKPDLELAEKIAAQANESTHGEEPQVLDTLARIQFLKGRKDEAVKLQEKALEKADDRMRPLFQQTLDSYKQGKVPPASRR